MNDLTALEVSGWAYDCALLDLMDRMPSVPTHIPFLPPSKEEKKRLAAVEKAEKKQLATVEKAEKKRLAVVEKAEKKRLATRNDARNAKS
jgi:hypothetical protein